MPKAVAKYNLSGELVATYASVREAARQNYMSLGFLYHLLRKDSRFCQGYLWQALKSPNAIPQKIPAMPVKPVISKNLRKN